MSSADPMAKLARMLTLFKQGTPEARVAALHMMAFNQENPTELIGKLIQVLEREGLNDAVAAIRRCGVPRMVNRVWQERNQGRKDRGRERQKERKRQHKLPRGMRDLRQASPEAPMRSKNAKADVTPVRQRTQFSCMAASMMMCLRAQGLDVDEDTVNRVMGAAPMKGASWEDAIACAQHFGMRVHLICPATVKQVKEFTDAGTPVMIAWNPEGRDWSHASVVFDVDKDMNVHVADPNIPDPDETVRVVPKGEFYGKWSEKWPNYLVRRPALAVEREITSDGKQVVAARTASTRVAYDDLYVDQNGYARDDEGNKTYVGRDMAGQYIRPRDLARYEKPDPAGPRRPQQSQQPRKPRVEMSDSQFDLHRRYGAGLMLAFRASPRPDMKAQKFVHQVQFQRALTEPQSRWFDNLVRKHGSFIGGIPNAVLRTVTYTPQGSVYYFGGLGDSNVEAWADRYWESWRPSRGGIEPLTPRMKPLDTGHLQLPTVRFKLDILTGLENRLGRSRAKWVGPEHLAVVKKVLADTVANRKSSPDDLKAIRHLIHRLRADPDYRGYADSFRKADEEGPMPRTAGRSPFTEYVLINGMVYRKGWEGEMSPDPPDGPSHGSVLGPTHSHWFKAERRSKADEKIGKGAKSFYLSRDGKTLHWRKNNSRMEPVRSWKNLGDVHPITKTNRDPDLMRMAGYQGNEDGQDIYPNEVGHGYGEPLAGGTDVMRQTQNRLLHEQGRSPRPDSPRLAGERVATRWLQRTQR